jgi:hypothetical protein
MLAVLSDGRWAKTGAHWGERRYLLSSPSDGRPYRSRSERHGDVASLEIEDGLHPLHRERLFVQHHIRDFSELGMTESVEGHRFFGDRSVVRFAFTVYDQKMDGKVHLLADIFANQDLELDTFSLMRGPGAERQDAAVESHRGDQPRERDIALMAHVA